MIFKNKTFTVYCKNNSYKKELDCKNKNYNVDDDKAYWKGYLIHREDGPAIEYKNGNKEWRFEGRLHRIDGPTIEWNWGAKDFYLNDKKYTEKEYWKIINCFKNKRRVLDEI